MRSLTLFLLLCVFTARADDPAPFEIREGDRVVLLGDALLERENTYGYLETRMHEQFPDRKFSVRNLSWAGDTPRGWSRASFDPPEKGFERLKEAIALVKPTVVFLGYGMAASLQEMTDRAQDMTLNRDEARYGRGGGGKKGGPETGEPEPMSAARFKKELGDLMDAILEISGRVGVSPAAAGILPGASNVERSPKPAGASPSAERPAGTPPATGGTPVLPGVGPVRFVLLSPIRHEDLRAVRPGLPDPAPHNALLEQYSKAIEELAKEKGARFVSFAAIRERPLGWSSNPGPATDNGIHLNAGGYKSAEWELETGLTWKQSAWRKAYNERVGKAHDAWSKDRKNVDRDRELGAASTDYFGRFEELRAAVLKKNDLFFHRFRPENATYLFGFRKHEQGQNAVEIPKFDPLIEAADAEIDKIKRAKGAGVSPTDPTGARLAKHDQARDLSGEGIADLSASSQNLPSQTLDVSQQTPDVSQQTPDVSQQTPDVSQQTPDVSQQTPNVGQQTPGVSRQTPGVSQQAPDVSQQTPAVSQPAGYPSQQTSDLRQSPPGLGLETATDCTPPILLAQNATPPARTTGTPPPLPDFTVADGYQIDLWAQNPLMEKPTQMNWDALGRLWVCSSSLYPQIEPGQKADDKILILEDTDRDGKADKSTVFADGLLIPTAVVPDLVSTAKTPGRQGSDGASRPSESLRLGDLAVAPSGCYVGQSTELLHFTDTDGDGKADTKRVVFSGFGTEDTHHLIHTLKWGPDGRLYWNQSIYIHSHLETPWGMVRLNSGGIFAYDPRTERVEVFAKGWCNPWGHAWDQWGQSFVTDGAGSQGISWVIPGAMYFTYENGRRICPSISPGNYPKFCALEIIHSPHFPDDWQGNAVTNDFRAHRVVRFAIEDLAVPRGEGRGASEKNAAAPAGNETPRREAPNTPSPLATRHSPLASGYTTREMPDLVRTNDQSFRPIDIRLGPDGALYVADWSNPVINHGEVDFRDPRRDKHLGRIWRISKKDTPPVKWEPLVAAAPSSPEVPAAPSPQSAKAGEASAKEASKADGGRPDRGATPLSNEALLEKLLSKNAWEKEQARQVLWASAGNHSETRQALSGILMKRNIVERNPDDVPEIKGVWILDAILLSDRNFFDALTSALDAGGRAVAARLVGKAGAEALRETQNKDANDPYARENQFVTALSNTARNDSSARVRVEAMRALSRIPTAESAALVLEAAMKSPGESGAINARGEEKGGQFDKPTFSDTKDPHYGYAAWLSINDLAKPWTDAIASGAWKADTAERQQQLAWGLRAIDPALAGATISRLFSENKIPLDGTGPWIELLGQAGGAKELRGLLDRLIAAQLPADAEPRALAALAEAARLRNLRPEGDLKTAAAKLSGRVGVPPAAPGVPPGASNVAHAPAAIRLLGLWKLEDAVIDSAAAMDAKTPPELRFASIDALRSIGSPSSLNLLEVLTRPDQDLAIRRAALVAITQVKLDAGVVKAADVLPAITDENAALETWRALLAVKGAPEAFAVRLPKELPKPVAVAGVRAAREAGKNGAKLLAALTPLAGISDAEAKMPKDFKALAAQAKQNGDPARGELIYRRAALTCVVCHAIGGAGGKVGPDMTSLGASAPLDYIIESTLNPAVKVKEGYNAVTLTLKDGTQAIGVQVRETPEEVFLRDATGREQRVPKAQIASTANLGSLMPAGLTDQLQDRERLDLFAFLGELGKPGPYDASKGSVARYWQLVNEPLQEDGTPHVNAAALPAFTLVDGRLLKEQLAELLPGITARGETVIYAAARFQSTGGKSRLKLTGASKVSLDGKPLALETDLAPDLAPGVHTIVVKLDVSALPEVLRVESPDARFLGN